MVCALPHDTATTGRRKSIGANPDRLSPSSPVPSCPNALSPVANTVSSAQQTTAWAAPAAAAAIVLCEARHSFCATTLGAVAGCTPSPTTPRRGLRNLKGRADLRPNAAHSPVTMTSIPPRIGCDCGVAMTCTHTTRITRLSLANWWHRTSPLLHYKRKLIFKHLRLAVARWQTTTAVSYVSLYQFSLNCNLVRSILVLINVNLWQALLVFYLVFYLACTGHLRQSRRLVTHRMARLE